MKKTILVKSTHIEIAPYEQGMCPTIEKDFSVWVKAEFRRDYIACFYDMMNKRLYLPKGASISKIRHYLPDYEVLVEPPANYRYCKPFKMTAEPKNSIQKEGIKFLTNKERFQDNYVNSQLALNIDTGDGKTFCTISAISQYNLRTIVIVHKLKLKEQWAEEFSKVSDIDPDRILNITSSGDLDILMQQRMEDIVHDIFIVTHQTLLSYAKSCGTWTALDKLFRKLGIGIKVYDECHKFFHNCLMIDFSTNVYKSFYLTATFSRSDAEEMIVFRKAYSSLAKFGEETFNYDDKIKHIILIVIYYRSNPSSINKAAFRTRNYGFSNYKFIRYVMNDENRTLVRVLKRIMEKCENINGRTLVVSPTIESTEFFAKEMRSYTNKTVSTYHSGMSTEDKANAYDADIISSTIKSTAEGDNIPELRKTILLDVVGPLLMDQFRGRLRVYHGGEDTFMFCPVDCSVEDSKRIFDKSLPMFKRKCKEIITMTMDDL